MNSGKTLLFALASMSFAFTSCETDDIEPEITVGLSSSALAINENGGSSSVIATLNATTSRNVTVNLGVTGTASGNGVDYTLSGNQITIPSGSLNGQVSINAVQDNLQEGNETIEILATSADGAKLTSANQVSITVEDDDVASGPNLILNEICYDPSNNGLDGDANGDGIYSQDDDSFVEIYNASTNSIDLSGYELWDDTLSGTLQYTLPSGTIVPAQQVLLVFGGGTPTGSFGNSVLRVGGSGLNLNNSGEVFGLKSPSGEWVLVFNTEPLSNNPNESYTRNPDLTGQFEQHGRISSTSPLFSPGTKIDGTPF